MNDKVVLPIFLEPAYRLTQLISDGKFTQTFFAVDEGEYPFVPCVVQRISLQHHAKSNLETKVQILQQLNGYLHVPKLLNYLCTSEYFYLVFEYFDGANLNKLLSNTCFNENQIWQMLGDILPILNLLHNHQLIHCDIKPHNIILHQNDKSESFVLVDFATAQILGAVKNNPDDFILGSPEYVAPEQIHGKPVFSSDLYSLGVTCIHLLTQIPPFDLFDIANNEWVWRHYLQSPISTRLSYILDKLISQDINHRFQSVDEVLTAMGQKPSILTAGLQNRFQHNIKHTQAPIQLSNTHTLTLNTHFKTEVNSVDIHFSTKLLASAHDNKAVYIWDLVTKQILHTLSGHLQPVKSVAFSSDGKLITTGSDDKTIKLWNLDTKEEIYTLTGHKHAVKSVAFSPDGQIIASGSWDKTVRLWDVTTGKEICVQIGHKLQVSAVSFSPDGLLLASTSFDKTACLWKLTQINNHFDLTLHSRLSSHTWAVTSVAFSPDGKMLATGSDDNTIKLWDIDTGLEIATFSGHSWSITALVFSSTGEILISASKDKTIKFWQVNSDSAKKEIMTLSGHTDSVTSIAAAGTNALIISGSTDKTIKLWS